MVLSDSLYSCKILFHDYYSFVENNDDIDLWHIKNNGFRYIEP